MRVSVELPEQKSDPLLKQLAVQFEAMQKKLQGMKESPDMKPMLQMLAKSQDAMCTAMCKAMEKMGGGKMDKSDSAILDALRGLKKAIADLPDDLKGALNGSYKKTQEAMTRPRVTVRPEVTVNLDGLNRRLGRMEEALVNASKRSRSRTFGSNY